MITTYTQMMDSQLMTKDGANRRQKDIYFDDTTWNIRYLILDSYKWLPGRKVMIYVDNISINPFAKKGIKINLTLDQIKNSPPVSENMPVSRQHEVLLSSYYGWAPYWVPYTGRIRPFVRVAKASQYDELKPWRYEIEDIIRDRISNFDPHLRSCEAVLGSAIDCTDDQFGTVQDFLIDAQELSISHLVIKDRHWLKTNYYLLPTIFAEEIRNTKNTVRFPFHSDVIRHSPRYNQIEFDERKEREIGSHYFRHYLGKEGEEEGEFGRRQPKGGSKSTQPELKP